MKVLPVATSITLVAALAVTPVATVTPAHADGRDALAGALIGGIVGHAMGRQQERQKQQQRVYVAPRKAAPTISSAERERNREVQTALNHFGFPAGTPDGALGPRSRSAISSYQATLGYAPTGQLSEYERTILTTAYHRAIAGGPAVSQVISSSPMGMRGLLTAQRDEMAGIPNQAAMVAAPMPQITAPPAVVAAPVAVALPALVAEPPAAEVAAPAPAPAPALTALPSFGGTLVSLSSHCNSVALKTSSNGGYATLAAMGDPSQALSEQFCLSRASAIQQGEELIRSVPGVTPAQVADQCKAFGPVLKDHVTAVSLRSAPEVLAGVTQFIEGSGMAPAQLSATSKICLGVGYAEDEPAVAIGSALVLSALGEAGYSQLPGFHLADGIGATRRPDLALSWFELAKGAGSMPGAAPGQADLVHKAIFMLNGRSEAPAATPALPVLAPAPQVVVEAPPASVPAVQPVLTQALTAGAAASQPVMDN